jgi:uncharacterized protein (TIGR02145 family)
MQFGVFGSRGSTATYWTSTASGNSAAAVGYKNIQKGTTRYSDSKNLAFSVRCLKD